MNFPSLEYGDWGSQASLLIDSMPEEPDAYIHFEIDYDSLDHFIDVISETTFLTQNSNQENYKLIITITEDSIIKPQKVGISTEMNYEHNHVLRNDVNGTWEELLHNELVSKGSVFTKDYYNIKLGTDWVAENCHVVTYVYYDMGSGNNDRPIIQAQEVKVK